MAKALEQLGPQVSVLSLIPANPGTVQQLVRNQHWGARAHCSAAAQHLLAEAYLRCKRLE